MNTLISIATDQIRSNASFLEWISHFNELVESQWFAH